MRADIAALAAAVERLDAAIEGEAARQRAALHDLRGALSVLQDRKSAPPPVPPPVASAAPQTPPEPEAHVPAGAVPLPPPEQDLRLQDLVRQAAELYRSGSYRAAREHAAAALALEPADRRARLLHGLSLYNENPTESGVYSRVEADLLAFEHGADADPEAVRVLARVAMEQGRWELARERLARAAALQPGRADDAKALGFCALRLGDRSGARGAFDGACTLAPNDAEAWHYAGIACMEMGEREAALARFARCLAIDASFAAARLRAGALLADLGRSSEALETLAPARRLPDAAALIGDCHERLGDASAARAAWLQAAAALREGGDADRLRAAGLYVRLARSAWQSGAYTDCIAYCSEGLRRTENPMLRALLGGSEVALGEVDKGRRLLQQIVDAHGGTEAGALAAASLAAASGIGGQ